MIVSCPQCHRDVDSPYENLGRRVRCPLCGAAFTVALPRVIPVGDEPDVGSGLSEFAAARARPAPPATAEPAHEGSGLHEFTRHAASAAAPRGDSGRVPSVGWHVMTPRGWVGPMHIVQLARAVWMGKIHRTTLLCLADSDDVIQAGSLRGLFPATSPPARPDAPPPAPAEPAGDGDLFDALTAADLDPAAALEQLAQT
ncbi:MAG: hypothetical protein NT031_08305 [Planctomycetota bacterium]|nr:hypothetical protein [Planctomycetota bacterium]